MHDRYVGLGVHRAARVCSAGHGGQILLSGATFAVLAVGADVAFTDIKMPPTHVDEGLVAAGEIRRLYPDVGVLVLSQYLDSEYALRLIENYPARVGYLLKDRVMDVAILGDEIRRIAEGECVVDPTIVSRLLKGARRAEPELASVVARS
jgi:DNA-binding NarL/FixJ family response regulator